MDAVKKQLLDALRFISLTVDHRDGLRGRNDLITADERKRMRDAVAAAEEEETRERRASTVTMPRGYHGKPGGGRARWPRLTR